MTCRSQFPFITASPHPQVERRAPPIRRWAKGNETVTNCHGLEMNAAPKSGRFKCWLSKTGRERLEEQYLSIDDVAVALTGLVNVKDYIKKLNQARPRTGFRLGDKLSPGRHAADGQPREAKPQQIVTPRK